MNFVVLVDSRKAVPVAAPSAVDGQLGNLSDDIAQAGTQIFGSIFGGGGAAAPKVQFKGSAQIQAGGSQLISQMQQILAQVQADPSTGAQGYQLAQQLRATLDNPQVFYPAKHGDDAAKLASFKSQADALLQQIQTAANASAGSGQTGPVIQTPSGPMVQTTGSNGQIVLVPATSDAATIAGIPITYLLIGGVGLVALSFFLSSK